MLFKEGIRTNTEHRKRRSSMFEFLDTSAWSICDLLRDYLANWATDFNNDREWTSRFTSKDSKQHHSAELELILYTILKNQGFKIEKHPDLGKDKKLDF